MNTEDEDLLYATGYDDCIIGICHRFNQPTIVAYDKELIIRKIMLSSECSYEDASEFFDFNIIGAYMGELTPCFIDTKALSDDSAA